MTKYKICIVGDVLVDVVLKTTSDDIKMRLGGVIHAARALWALDIPFSVRFFSPSYLDEQITGYLNSLGCTDIAKLGNVTGSPYTILVEEPKEIGNQGYEFLLRDEIKIEYQEQELEKMVSELYSDYLVFAGNFSLEKILGYLNGNVHLDIANNICDLTQLKWAKKITSIFVSTSSSLFQNIYSGEYNVFAGQFDQYCERLILKENRGGSRAIDFSCGKVVQCPSQIRRISHSIGVGDCYDATYVCYYRTLDLHQVLVLSSWIAAEYAATSFPDDFKREVLRICRTPIKDLASLGGVTLPWEKRKLIDIYIAAPDFDHVDTTPIDILYNAMQYHNFNPHRPIQEYGQMSNGASKSERQQLFRSDLALLTRSSLLVAVLLYDDPGTLIEIGLAAGKNIPTIVYDPYNKANNCMLTELPILVSSNLDNIITEVFVQGQKLKFDE